MQSLIQQFGVRATTLLTRRHPKKRIARANVGPSAADARTNAEPDRTADGRLEMFNGLLHSVCHKLLAKIRELDRVSGELENIMKVCAVPVICVDDQLVVRSFTRESRRIYRLSHQDVGRSLLDVSCGFNYCSLGDDFRKVAQTGKSVSRYLEQRGCEGRFFLRILPNFCGDNSFAGAVLIFSQVEGRDWGTA